MRQEKLVYRKTTTHVATVVVIFMPVLLMFSGCSSLSKVQCLEGDWYEIGLRDGESGVESAQFNVYLDTCAKYDVVPDFAKYSEGRWKGLESFCTLSMGYSVGREGKEYRGVCTGTSEELFLVGHSLGDQVHSTEEMVKSIDEEMRTLNAQIETLENQIADLQGAADLDSDTTSDIYNQLSLLGQDLREAEDKIKPLQKRRNDAIIEYREAIEEAIENGVLEALDVKNEKYFRDESANP